MVRAISEAQSMLMVGQSSASNHHNHFSSLLSLFLPRRIPRSYTSNSSTVGSGYDGLTGNLEPFTFSHWFPFRRKSSQRHRSASRRRRGNQHEKWSKRSHSSETFSWALDDGHAPQEGEMQSSRHNGNLLEDLSSLGSTIPSRTCSRCNSTLQVS